MKKNDCVAKSDFLDKKNISFSLTPQSSTLYTVQTWITRKGGMGVGVC